MKLKFNDTQLGCITLVVLIIVISVAVDYCSKPSKETAAETTQPVEKAKTDTASQAPNAHDYLGKMSYYSRELDAIDPKAEYSEIADINDVIRLFSSCAKTYIYLSGTEINDPVSKKDLALFKAKLIAVQKKEFPILRKKYVSVASEKVWENNMEVHIGGANNTVIEFINGDFADHKAIKESHALILDELTDLRFKRANYKWIPHDDEFTYYTIDSPKDTEIKE